MLNNFGPSKAVKVPTESEGYPSDPGLSFPLDVLFSKYPDTVIFWIVRHPFDAVCSLRIGIDQNWAHHPRPPDWQSWLDNSLIERCSHHWAYINQYGYEAVQNNATLVRFEDLIESPGLFAKIICERVGVDAADCEDSLASWSGRVQNQNNDKFIEALTSRHHSRPDHKVRVERWRENLTTHDTQVITTIVKSANKPFGYSLVDDRRVW